MLVSPTEPKKLRDAGKVSLVPENYGCDVLIHSASYGPVGVQRKEINDLVSSLRDGRLGRQLIAMKQLDLTVLLLEGKPRWTADGSLIGNTNYTRTQHLGVTWSVQSRGIWIASTDSLDDTIAWLSLFQKWCAKVRKTSSLESRPKGRDEFGKDVQGRDFAIHLLQSFPGVGREVAGNVVDHFGGVPFQWNVTEEELYEVKGLGKGRVKKLFSLLQPLQSSLQGTTAHSTSTDPFPKLNQGKDSSGRRSSVSSSGSSTGRARRGSSRAAKATEPPIDDWITIEDMREGT